MIQFQNFKLKIANLQVLILWVVLVSNSNMSCGWRTYSEKSNENTLSILMKNIDQHLQLTGLRALERLE